MKKLYFLILCFSVALYSNAQTIVVSTTSLSGFTYLSGAGPSTQNFFTVSGNSLNSAIAISLPTEYEMSTLSGFSFIGTNSLTINQSGGTINSTIIFVRLKNGLATNTYNGNITLSSDGAISQSISLSGSVVYNLSSIITTSVISFTGFTYVSGFGPSTQKSFTVSGTGLSGPIILTSSSDFEISLTTGARANTISLPQTNGNVTSTRIYVRLKSGLSPNSFSGILTIFSDGALGKSIPLNGTVTTAQTISISDTNLSEMNYAIGGGPSLEKSFTVSGSLLTSNIIITPPTNFEISMTSGTSFASTAITLTNVSGSVTPTTIYVRLKSGLSLNSYSGSISLTSTGAINKDVNCTGSVLNPSLIVSTNNISYLYYTQQNQIHFIVSGIGLKSSILIAAPTNFEISTGSAGNLFSGSSQILLSQSKGFLIETPIYVRLIHGLSDLDYTGNITINSTGVESQSVSVSGNPVYTNLINSNVKLSISTFGNQIRITGAKIGELIEVYNLNGILIKREVAKTENTVIWINNSGVFIIKIGEQVRKVIL